MIAVGKLIDGRLIDPNPAVSSIESIKSNVAYNTRGVSNSPHLLSAPRIVPDGQ
jgi:hypothetical protein